MCSTWWSRSDCVQRCTEIERSSNCHNQVHLNPAYTLLDPFFLSVPLPHGKTGPAKAALLYWSSRLSYSRVVVSRRQKKV